MFAGHAALALASKRVTPRLSLGILVAASYAIDLIWPLLLFAGVEVVRVDPGNTAFTPLDFESYPWTHSLLLTIVWAVLAGLVTWVFTRERRASAVVSFLVASHWLLDFVTHRPDLPLTPRPGSPVVGLGLWNSIAGTLVIEGALFIVCAAVYIRGTRARDRIGSIALGGFLVLIFVVWASGPFGPPPPNARAVMIVTMALWLLPPWAGWFDRHRDPVGADSDSG